MITNRRTFRPSVSPLEGRVVQSGFNFGNFLHQILPFIPASKTTTKPTAHAGVKAARTHAAYLAAHPHLAAYLAEHPRAGKH